MFDFLTPVLIMAIIVFGFYKILELYARKNERMRLIEKIGEINNLDLPKLTQPLFNLKVNRSTGLKAGCLLAGLGFGLLLAFIICSNAIPYYSDPSAKGINRYTIDELAGVVYGSSALLCGGIGLIIAFIVDLKVNKDK